MNTQLTNFLEQFIDEHDVPGLTIAITMDDEIIYSHAFGVRNIDSGKPMKEIYFFHMASVSKPFVATAVMQLMEQRKMDLDENVTTYLPYFKLDDEKQLHLS
jgi:CubicO group peptidase (beta-lactamase class C family)